MLAWGDMSGQQASAQSGLNTVGRSSAGSAGQGLQSGAQASRPEANWPQRATNYKCGAWQTNHAFVSVKRLHLSMTVTSFAVLDHKACVFCACKREELAVVMFRREYVAALFANFAMRILEMEYRYSWSLRDRCEIFYLCDESD